MAILTFQYLRELQKKERDLPALQQIEPSFYKTLSECIKSSSDENFTSIARSILDMRERKIVSSAIKSARADLKPHNLLPQEEPLFLEVCNALKNHRTALEQLMAKESAPEEIVDAEKAPDTKTSLNLAKIRALSDIPAFVGEDLKAYGPFAAGETADIPKKAAEILANSKSIELLE